MTDTISRTINFSSIWQYVGPLIGVVFGYLISTKVWGWQKRWEMKREALFDVLRDLCQFDSDLHDLANICISFNQLEASSMRNKFLPERKIARERFVSCNARIRASKFIAEMLVGKTLNAALSKFYEAIWTAGNELWDGKDQSYMSLHSNREQLEHSVHEAARTELNIKNTVMSRMLNKLMQ